MRILLLGDYSNYHATLAAGLRRLGHDVIVASDGTGWMNTARNVSLIRPLPGLAGGALLYGKMLIDNRLKGYDVVSLINPSFVTLRPARLRRVFDRLKKNNGSVFLAAVGNDKAYMDMVTAYDCPLRYTEYRLPGGVPNCANAEVLEKDMEWQKGEIGEFCEFVYDNVSGVTTALYEYHLAMSRRIGNDRVAYCGIPIDLERIVAVDRPLVENGRVKIFLGRHRHRMAFKGTDIIGRAAERLCKELPSKCELEIVENIPYDDYVKRLRNADIVLDQLYSYTPATNALLAMAAGQATLSGGEPEFYDFIGEKEMFPVINALPDETEVYNTLKHVVENPEVIVNAGAIGRKFVDKHNAAELVARRCMNFWESKM